SVAAGDDQALLCRLGGATLQLSWRPDATLAADADLLLRVVPRDVSYAPGSSAHSDALWVSVDSLPAGDAAAAGESCISDAEISVAPAPGDRLVSFTLRR